MYNVRIIVSSQFAKHIGRRFFLDEFLKHGSYSENALSHRHGIWQWNTFMLDKINFALPTK